MVVVKELEMGWVWLMMVLFLNEVTSELVRVKLLHMADLNQMVEACEEDKCSGGLARLVSAIKKERTDNSTYTFLAGDFNPGTTWFYLNNDADLSKALNILGLDAAGFGRTRFGSSLVKNATEYVSGVNFPYVSTNVNFSHIVNISQYVVLTKGCKIGVLGYFEFKFDLETEIVDSGPVRSLSQVAYNLRHDEGVKTFILLTNSNEKTQKYLVENLALVDVVIGPGGGKYPTYMTRRTHKVVPILRSTTNELGVLNMDVNKETGRVVHSDGKRIQLTGDVPQDSAAKSLEDDYKSKEITAMTLIVQCHVFMDDGDQCAQKECSLGNFITDSFVDFSFRLTGEKFCPIGVVSGGLIKGNIRMMSKYNLCQSLKTSSLVMVLVIKGSGLMRTIIDGFFKGELMQVSGIRIVLRKRKYSPVLSAYFRSDGISSPGYEEFDEEKFYRVITNKYTSNKIVSACNLKEIHSMDTVDIKDVDVVLMYAKNKGLIYPGEDQRIVLV